MNKQEIESLLNQIRCMILNKPLPTVISEEGDDSADVQQAIIYLSECLSESNQFLKALSMGELNAPVPSRKNFLAGNLKELHSGLKHLTWQANQVAQGDYNQHVSFMGEFSDSFNKMVFQLREREEKLLRQSDILSQTNALMHSIMDGMADWIVVMSQQDNNILYTNKAAQQLFVNTANDGSCENLLLTDLKQNAHNQKGVTTKEYECKLGNRIFRISTFTLQWNDTAAYANHIVDVTGEFEGQSAMQNMAYKDELTGLYNRRYCIDKLKEYTTSEATFTFCMIDVDKLKYANDTFGHSAGDEYLGIVARELCAVTRSTDVVCRIGGDEFAVIFPDCSPSTAETKLDNLNKDLIAYDVGYPMAVSYGLIGVTNDNTLSYTSIIMQADNMMYRNKNKRKKDLQNI